MRDSPETGYLWPRSSTWPARKWRGHILCAVCLASTGLTWELPACAGQYLGFCCPSWGLYEWATSIMPAREVVSSSSALAVCCAANVSSRCWLACACTSSAIAALRRFMAARVRINTLLVLPVCPPGCLLRSCSSGGTRVCSGR